MTHLLHPLSFVTPKTQTPLNILRIVSQAAHDLLPPDLMAPIVQSLLNNFINDTCSSDAICAGINCLRTCVTRCPLCVDEEVVESVLMVGMKANGLCVFLLMREKAPPPPRDLSSPFFVTPTPPYSPKSIEVRRRR